MELMNLHLLFSLSAKPLMVGQVTLKSISLHLVTISLGSLISLLYNLHNSPSDEQQAEPNNDLGYMSSSESVSNYHVCLSVYLWFLTPGELGFKFNPLGLCSRACVNKF